MAFATLREMVCTLCARSFHMVCGEMVHPADVLCDACVRELWTRAERGIPLDLADELEPRFAGREVGLPTRVVAVQMAQRAYKLRRMFSDPDEVDDLLRERRKI